MVKDCPFELEPLAQSELSSTTEFKNANYTNQDFHSLKRRLVQFIEEKFPDDFTDFVESSLAIMLIENWAFIGDMLSFKMDQQFNEIFLDAVTEIDNAFRLSKQVGFSPTPPLPAKALFSATITNILTTDLIIGTPVLLDTGVGGETLEFEVFPADNDGNPIIDEDIIISAGKLSNLQVAGVEGRTRTNSFEGDGSVNQSFTLTFFPVIFDSITVEVDGIRWEQVDNFTDSQPRAEYRVEFNSDYSAFIIFGNSRGGQIPSVGSQVVTTYRTGGGTRGNVVTGTFSEQLNIQSEELSFSIPVLFTNYTKAEGGYDGDKIEEIRESLPRYLSTQDRAVSGSDIKILADQFVTPFNGQIGKSTAVLRNTGCAGNIIDLYVLEQDETTLKEASDVLKSKLSEELDEKKVFTEHICIKDGVIVEVDTRIDVILDKIFRKIKTELEIKITNRVNSFFAVSNWEYGKTLKDTDLIKSLSDVTEVTSYDITFTTADSSNSGNIVTTKFYEIIRPDEIDISFTFE